MIVRLCLVWAKDILSDFHQTGSPSSSAVNTVTKIGCRSLVLLEFNFLRSQFDNILIVSEQINIRIKVSVYADICIRLTSPPMRKYIYI